MSQEHLAARASDYDWSFFDVYMDFAQSPEAVYDAWATSAGMERFFVRCFTYTDSEGTRRQPSDRAQAGDTYDLEFDHPFRLSGRVVEAEAGKRLAFTFPTVMVVTVEVTPHSGGTRLHLRQSGLGTDDRARIDEHLNCRSCWIYFLMNLKSVLQGGPDLRDDPAPADNIVSVYFHSLVMESSAE